MNMNNKIVNELTDYEKNVFKNILNTGNIVIICDVSKNEDIYTYSECEAFDHFHCFFESIPYYLIIKTKEEVKIYNYNIYMRGSASLNINAYNELEEHFKNLPNMLNYNYKYMYYYSDFARFKYIDVNSTIYINTNKYNIDFEQHTTSLKFYISVNPVNNHYRANKFAEASAYNINSILESINGIRSNKEEYYLKLVKAMCEKNNFKKYYGEIADFEDKMIICNLYKEHYENI